jgi:uncharacterized protein (DUF1800 family)
MLSSQAFIAANRFGYGADQTILEQAGTEPKAWLLQQLDVANIAKELASFDNAWSSKTAIKSMAIYRQKKKQDKVNAKKASMQPSMQAAPDDEKMMMLNSDSIQKQMNKSAAKSINLTIAHQITTQNPFYWRLVDFFSNHFSVSASGQIMRALAPTLENEGIAPNISGYFSEMLVAVESHPAMLIYLNNEQSVGPNSKFGQRAKGKKGLNENLAREILELHTLGVDAGYDQSDVTELARAITGWGVDNNAKKNAGFTFRAGFHEPGKRQVFGRSYKSGGVEQGIAILKDLAEDPKTAEHVSRKLVTHFVSDQAPQEIVDQMVSIWASTKGYLPKVIEAMMLHPLSWSETPEKFKTPREFMISTCKACDIKRLRPDFIKSLTILGQKPFSAGSPAGYKDTQEYWAGPRAMMGRIEWAEHVSKFAKLAPMEIATGALGPQLNKLTQLQISRAESKQQAVTLFLMSPEFQKR